MFYPKPKKMITTLFMLESVDGKISTGASDDFDFDTDLPKISGTKSGLQQYYDLQQTTDLWSLNTGRVMSKIGINNKGFNKEKMPVSFIIVDAEHLTEVGVTNLSNWVKELIIVTSNKNHPVFKTNLENVTIIKQETPINFKKVFTILSKNIDRITIESGSTLNYSLLHDGLIDYINIVVAPILIGGVSTPSLIGGDGISSINELKKCTLTLIEATPLKNNYLQLKYSVNK